MATYLIMSNLEYAGLEDKVKDAVDPVLDKYARKALLSVQDHWDNWKNGTGRSRAAWTARVQDGVIVLENPLGYVMHVHRAGESARFVDIVMARVNAEVTREMWDELAEVVRDALVPEVTGEVKL